MTSREGRSTKVAAWAFAAYLLVAGTLIVFVFGRGRWFYLDEWWFLADRGVNAHDLFQPYEGHWCTLPILVFRALYDVVGVRSYRPYLATIVVVHLATCALLRVLMRRAGVRPWLASIVAGSFVLFGSGAENIVWAFQITLVGSLAFGLLQLVLADHDGSAFGSRDVFALLAGAAGLMSSAASLPILPAVGLVVGVRRGWRRGVAQVAPLVVLYGAWTELRPSGGLTSGAPSWAEPLGLEVVARSVGDGFRSIWIGLAGGHGSTVVAVVLAFGVGAGVVVAGARGSWQHRSAHLLVPCALACASVGAMAATGVVRWYYVQIGPPKTRYVYLYVALALPLVAAAFEAVVARRPRWGAVMVAALLLGVPGNVTQLRRPVDATGTDFTRQRTTLESVAQLPHATALPEGSTVLGQAPVVGGYPPSLAWVRHAQSEGKLAVVHDPSEADLAEAELTLGIVLTTDVASSPRCRTVSGPTGSTVSVDRGDRLEVRVPRGPAGGVAVGVVTVSLVSSPATSHDASMSVVVRDRVDLLGRFDGLQVQLSSTTPTFTLCGPRR